MNRQLFETQLLEFGKGLGPPKDYVEHGKAALHGVTDILKTQQNTYPIDRVIPSGSIAKATSLVGSDFDCVLFINGLKPPYARVLNFFKQLLESRNGELTKKGIVLGKIVTTRFSLQFKIKMGLQKVAYEFDVDLLVAGNFVEAGNGDRAQVQRLKALEYIEANPGAYYHYSSDLAESQVKFMKDQEAFTHAVVRLCKYWLKEMDLGWCRSGVKGALELLAVRSAQDAIAKQNRSIRSAFLHFLDAIVILPQLRVYFHPNGTCANETQLHHYGSLALTLPRHIASKSGYVLDPANPYNDLADDLFTADPYLYPKLKNFAMQTKQKFEAEEANVKWNGQAYEYDFKAFFERCSSGLN